jgi:hypothetical protein
VLHTAKLSNQATSKKKWSSSLFALRVFPRNQSLLNANHVSTIEVHPQLLLTCTHWQSIWKNRKTNCFEEKKKVFHSHRS